MLPWQKLRSIRHTFQMYESAVAKTSQVSGIFIEHVRILVIKFRMYGDVKT